MRATTTAFCLPRPGEGELPAWPAVSIGLLVVCSGIFAPGLVTVMNLYLLFLAAMVWSGSPATIDRSLALAAAPFVAILAIGLAGGFGADRYLYFKDAWYISNPMVILCIGYLLYLCKPDMARGLRAFVIAGSLLALLHLSQFALHPEILRLSAVTIRDKTSTVGGVSGVFALIILLAYLGQWRQGLSLPAWLGWLCLVVCSLSLVASFSRTNLLVAAIGVLAARGVFCRREWLRVGAIVLAALALIAVLRVTVDLYSEDAGRTFVGKLARSVDELTVAHYSNARDINANWRGYETARALDAYLAGGPRSWLVGHGFGATVGLGNVLLGNMHEIPIFHNGYAYLLVKGGAAAVLLYAFVLGHLYLSGRRLALRRHGHDTFLPARLLQGIAVNLACTTWIVSGVFNKLLMFSFLLAAGFLLAALTRERPDPA